MSTQIHESAIVDPKAKIGCGVAIGPYAIVEAGVEIGDECEIGPLCRIARGTSIGPRNRFESHCSIGAPPQDLKYDGEPTRLEIGEGNTFREFVTMHRGTAGGGGVTTIGDGSLFMAYTHVAHDCHVGSHTIFDNCGTLAGHVTVEDFVTVGAFSAVHQFCRVGRYAFMGGFTVATQDVLPFMTTVGGRPAKCFGPNTIGLKRKGFSPASMTALKSLWRIIRDPKLTTTEALDRAVHELGGQPEVDEVIEFIKTSERGVIIR
jgi:UDP-N-acetylglucosamine acyltransferase